MDTARTRARSAGAVGICAALIAVSACGSSGPAKRVTTSSTPSVSAGSPAPMSASSPAGSSGSGAPSTSASPARVTTLHGTCDTLLPQPEVEGLMRIHFVGRNAYVVGVPEKNVSRLAYLNCRYGLGASGRGTPAVEVGISLYASPDQARRRLTGTIGDYREHGAQQTSTTVAGLDATMLVGTTRGYDVPLLVLASGQRTVAVSVAANALPSSRLEPAMVKVAALALQRTAP